MTELLKVNRLQSDVPSTLAHQNLISRIIDVGVMVEMMFSERWGFRFTIVK